MRCQPPPTSTVFQFKEYCPLVFRNLRERFAIDDNDYQKSLTKCPKVMDSPGRSGAKFYLSQDQLYVVKTLTSEEVEQMHSLLKHYHPYIVERHGTFHTFDPRCWRNAPVVACPLSWRPSPGHPFDPCQSSKDLSSRKDVVATVFGHVSAHGGQHRALYGRHAQHILEPPQDSQEV